MKEELHTVRNRLPNIRLASKYLPKNYSNLSRYPIGRTYNIPSPTNLLRYPIGRTYNIPSPTNFSNTPFTTLDKDSSDEMIQIKPEIVTSIVYLSLLGGIAQLV